MKRGERVVRMAVLATLATLVAVAAPGRAAAGPRVQERGGRLALGFGLGGGLVSVGGDHLACSTCEYESAAFLGGTLHVRAGGFVTDRLAVLGEGQLNLQHVNARVPVGMTTEVREAGMFHVGLLVAAQLWIAPRIWIKGGAGLARLLVSRSDPAVVADAPKSGLAVLGAAGLELRSRRRSAIDLQLRVLAGAYGSSDRVVSTSLGVGFNWY